MKREKKYELVPRRKKKKPFAGARTYTASRRVLKAIMADPESLKALLSAAAASASASEGERPRPARRNRVPKAWWITRGIRSGAIKRGCLRAKFAREYGLRKGQKIPSWMYSKALAKARARGDLKTIRRINLAKTFAKIGFRSRWKKALARRKAVWSASRRRLTA